MNTEQIEKTGFGGWLSRLGFLTAGLLVASVSVGTTAVAGFATRLHAFTSDDAYYYFLTAWNWAHGAGSTFDGINETNGYQPLWFWISAGVFQVFPDRNTGLAAMMTVISALWIGCVYAIWRIARQTFGTAAGLFGLCPFLVVGFTLFFTGVEVPAVAILLFAFISAGLSRNLFSAPTSTRTSLVMGTLLALLVMARLDTGIFVAVLMAGLLVTWKQSASWRTTLRSLTLLAAPAVATLVVYVVANLLAFGVPLPISGTAKQLAGLTWNESTITRFLTFGNYAGIPFFLGISTFAAGIVAILLTRTSASDAHHHTLIATRRWITVLLVAQVAQLLVYSIISSWRMEPWYYYLTLPSLVLSVMVIAFRVLAFPVLQLRPIPLAVAGAVVVVALSSAFALRVAQRMDVPVSDHSMESVDIAGGLWASSHLPDNARVAMGDRAGAFAYATRHPVIQTEGLVNSADFVEALRNGNVPARLTSQGVTYLAKFARPDAIHELPDQPGCIRFEEPAYGAGPKVQLVACNEDLVYDKAADSGDHLYIWRFRPEKNPSR
jgi:hypothetical protein